MGFIPEEIVILILSFLPVKSLFQFRCVSKSWRSFILSHPKLLGQRFVLAKEIYPIIDDDQASIPYRLIQLLGSCNGFFLIRADGDFFLWNPSTNCCKKVLKYMHVFPIGCREVMLSGLCYDESKDDYTILIAIKSPFGPWPQADFCSVKIKSWSHTYYNHNTFAKSLGAAADGCLYWLAIDDEQHRDIMHFDPSKKRMVDLAKPKLDKGEKIVGLGVIRDSLLSLTVFDDKKDHIKVLALVKCGVKLYWPILFVIPSHKLSSINISWSSPSRVMPLCFSKEGEFLMLVNDSQLLALDPTTGSIRIVKQAMSNYGPSLTVVTYMETLASASSHKLAVEEGFIATKICDLIPNLIIPS